MTNPVVVEAWRGGRVESEHRAAGAVVDAQGRVRFSFGDVVKPVYPRSAVKALQALPLVESGAADTLKLSDPELALACASHSGEASHVALAAAMLDKAGAAEPTLCCGSHWPLGADAARALARTGERPSQLHNNCSGKHSGFLCLSAHQGWRFEDYVAPEHPVQQAGRAAIEEMTQEKLGDERRGVDGCSIPTYAISLKGLALGFARFGSGAGLSAATAAAADRLRRAVVANPAVVAGTGRFDTEWMSRYGAKSFTKTGAEGVFVAALPDLGLGIAVKADDGAGRAAEVVIAALIARFAGFDESELGAAKAFLEPDLRNWRGLVVGALKAAGPLVV
jgi:L-asparaginase II